LRITSGTAGGRKLSGPKTGLKNCIRPTSDRVREALFSIIGDHVSNAVVLDLFSGTGALGIEALSRGANQAVFVDHSTRSIELIRKNLSLCFVHPSAAVMRLNLTKEASFRMLRRKFPDYHSFNLIFIDPPYEKKLAEKALIMVEKAGLTAPDGLVIAEERSSEHLPKEIGALRLRTHRRYGETGIWIYKKKTPIIIFSPYRHDRSH